MVLGFKPVDKPIIPRRSFFDKDHFLGPTGRFNEHQRGAALDAAHYRTQLASNCFLHLVWYVIPRIRRNLLNTSFDVNFANTLTRKGLSKNGDVATKANLLECHQLKLYMEIVQMVIVHSSSHRFFAGYECAAFFHHPFLGVCFPILRSYTTLQACTRT
jgi:hypothetical protein